MPEKKYENMAQFLQHNGWSNLREWECVLYKYTDCGPWCRVLVRREAAHDVVEQAALQEKAGTVYLVNPGALSDEFVHFFGLPRPRKTSLVQYRKLIQNFIRKHNGDGSSKFKRRIELITSTAERLVVGSTYRQEDVIVPTDVRHVGDDLSQLVGIEIGSIVEGSDVDIGPYPLKFPFTDADYWKLVNDVNDEASFYWKRDNTDNFTFKCDGKAVVHLSWTNFDSRPKWYGRASQVPQSVRRAWCKWYLNGGRSEPFNYQHQGKTWTTVEVIDDSTW